MVMSLSTDESKTGSDVGDGTGVAVGVGIAVKVGGGVRLGVEDGVLVGTRLGVEKDVEVTVGTGSTVYVRVSIAADRSSEVTDVTEAAVENCFLGVHPNAIQRRACSAMPLEVPFAAFSIAFLHSNLLPFLPAT